MDHFGILRAMDTQRPTPEQPIPAHATKIFTGKIFDVYQWPQRLFNGETATFEQIKRPDSVNVLPITQEGKIILTRQEQPGMKPFVGALGGRVDQGEEPEEAAKRELLEEAGIETTQLVLWDALQITEKVDWVIWTYIAKDCKKVSQQNVDAGEKIELIEVTFDEYLDVVAEDDYRDTEISLKLLKLARHPEQLAATKSTWLS